ncbi:MAG: small multi-drug export protein [Anaerolineae bacterium]|nr:small multi-drug export protein [Anaerolineae bacterium]
MTTLPKIASIFTLAFFTFWPAIPAGLALGLQPLVVIVTTTLSYVCGVLLVVVPGVRLRAWVMRRYSRQATLTPGSLLHRVWERYGLAGLGLLGPMTVGAQIGAILGLSLDAHPRRLLLWMSLGALAWSLLLTTLVALGLAAL